MFMLEDALNVSMSDRFCLLFPAADFFLKVIVTVTESQFISCSSLLTYCHFFVQYVRPGAAPIPGSAPVGPAGAPGQLRPPVHVGPVAGRGRGDWRPLQKSFHPGFGPVWGNNTSGRGFGSGLDFTLPSHK